jgi:hypothetical protein
MKRASLFIAAVALLFSTSTQAGNLTSSDFLKYSEVQQHWWYFGALQSISHMTYLLHGEEKAECVWNWLPTETDEKKELLRKSCEQFPDHSATSILIALLQRSCGQLVPDSGQ